MPRKQVDMPECVPSVTKVACHFPSTWRDAIGKSLTDKAIEQYCREGFYGPDEQRKQKARDKANVVNGKVMLARPCERCADGKKLGNFMRFAYLPKAGYYCDACRTYYKKERAKAIEEIRKWSRMETYE